MANYSLFSYKNGNSFLHKIPAWIKILVIPALNILLFNLPFYYVLGFIVFQLILACCLKFSLKEQFSDLLPVIFYAVLLYFTGYIAQVFTIIFNENFLWKMESVINALKISAKEVFTNKNSLIMLAKLFCVMQSTSIVFRTSTSLQIREGFAAIELFFRKIFHLPAKTPVANVISLFICFIPLVFRIWNQSVMAWKARQGKVSIRMFLTLLPVLFSVGMKNAFNTAKAMAIRS